MQEFLRVRKNRGPIWPLAAYSRVSMQSGAQRLVSWQPLETQNRMVLVATCTVDQIESLDVFRETMVRPNARVIGSAVSGNESDKEIHIRLG